MKKLSANINRTLSLTVGHNRISGQLVLVLLQFFINHGETMVYDVDPVFRAFLENYISVCCMISSLEGHRISNAIRRRSHNCIRDANLLLEKQKDVVTQHTHLLTVFPGSSEAFCMESRVPQVYCLFLKLC